MQRTRALMHARPLRAVGWICFTAISLAGCTRSQLLYPTPAPPAWMGLAIRPEGPRSGYDRDSFGTDYRFYEAEIIAGLPKTGARFYTPYTCPVQDMREDGTADTDIDHIVALAEAYDSGLDAERFLEFGSDPLNLTVALPAVNRAQKSDRDAAEWRPEHNQGWFATRVVAVKKKYRMTVDPAERDALESMLDADPSREVTC